MNKYLITYDLKNKSKNYENLYLSIKSLGSWWHYLESTWIVKTNLNSNSIWKKLGANIETSDRLLIVMIDGDKQGWIPQEAWNWLNTD